MATVTGHDLMMIAHPKTHRRLTSEAPADYTERCTASCVQAMNAQLGDFKTLHDQKWWTRSRSNMRRVSPGGSARMKAFHIANIVAPAFRLCRSARLSMPVFQPMPVPGLVAPEFRWR